MAFLWQSFHRSVAGAGRYCSGNERGVTLIETLIAIALLGIIGSVLMTGMAGVYHAVPVADEQEIGKQLAQSQIETAMRKPYALSYSPAPIPDIYPEYTAEIDVIPLRLGNFQRITVTIKRDGQSSATLEVYKANR